MKNDQLTFAERQLLLHNKAVRLLEQISENRRLRKSLEEDALMTAFDNKMPASLKRLHDKMHHDTLTECDKHRNDLLQEYAQIMELLVKPVFDKAKIFQDAE